MSSIICMPYDIFPGLDYEDFINLTQLFEIMYQIRKATARGSVLVSYDIVMNYHEQKRGLQMSQI